MKRLFYLSLSLIVISFGSAAQVPVSEEPMHHTVFQNDYVRILDVHIHPHDTTLFHKHELPSAFIILSNAKTGSELISDGAVTNAPVTYGNIWFDGFYLKPRIHRVWNSDTVEFHVMDVELLKKTYKEIGPPLQKKSMQMLFDEKPVRSYSYTLSAHSDIRWEKRNNAMLIVNLTDSLNEVTIDDRQFQKKCDFIFIPEGNKSTFVNNGNAGATLAIFELK